MSGQDDLKPSATIVRIAAEAAAYEYTAPDWKPCTQCGKAAVPWRGPQDARPSDGICVDCFKANRDALDKREQRERAQQVLEHSIPKRYQWATFGAPVLLKERVRVWQQLVPVAAERILLTGPPGSGKTSLGVALLRGRQPTDRAGGLAGLFVSALTLARARAEHRLGDGEAEIVERAIATPLLMLDDLGSEPILPSSAVVDVLAQRYDEMRPWIVTTGLKPLELAQRYGGGIARRLCEEAYIIELGRQS